MKVELFVLCDAATDYHGKLNILGTFDAIWTRQIPAVHPQCAVALRLRFTKIEEGAHKVRINIVDEDGKAVIPPLDAGVNIQFREALTSMSANMILNLQGLKFPKYGEYSIDLAVDGRQEASLPIYVQPVPAQA
ncbi:MAG: hypothetical protein HZB61_01800 [Nitrospirae bacterium]|nr:hypothetical protein [Nitrospirota bacterium]